MVRVEFGWVTGASTVNRDGWLTLALYHARVPGVPAADNNAMRNFMMSPNAWLASTRRKADGCIFNDIQVNMAASPNAAHMQFVPAARCRGLSAPALCSTD